MDVQKEAAAARICPSRRRGQGQHPGGHLQHRTDSDRLPVAHRRLLRPVGKGDAGRNVHIAEFFVNLAGAEAGITVSDFAGISYASQVFAQSDDYTGVALTGPTVPVRYAKLSSKAPVLFWPACHRGRRFDRPSWRDRRRRLRHWRSFGCGHILDEALGSLCRDAGPLAAETPLRLLLLEEQYLKPRRVCQAMARQHSMTLSIVMSAYGCSRTLQPLRMSA